MSMWARAVVFAVALLAAQSSAAQGALSTRVQEFKALDVTARLDAEGTLHVVERHEFLFTGDWNGGERVFNTPGPFQVFHLNALTRIDPRSGTRYPLTQGDLSGVDQYDLDGKSASSTLRWRSRLPRDPVFDHSPFVYEIAYEIFGVLWRAPAGRLVLSHEFVPVRTGPIGEMWIRLAFDPAWQMQETLPDEWHGRAVPPTMNHVVQATLWSQQWLPPRFRSLLLVFTLALALLISFSVWSERRRGRLGPVATIPEHEASAWIAEYLLRHPAEEIAVTWTASAAGPDAVAALLARLEHERKIQTHVDNHELVLELLVDRRTLEGHERALIEALFFEGDQTSTARIRKHYGTFHPARELEPHLSLTMLDRLGPLRPKVSLQNLPEAMLLAGGLYYAGWALGDLVIVMPFLFVFLFASAFGIELATRWRCNPHWGLLEARWFALCAGIPVVLAYVYTLIAATRRFAIFEYVLAAMLVALAIIKLVLSFAASRESKRGSEVRVQLKAIRQYLQHQLEAGAALPDAIVPYLFALGLAPEARLWFGLETQDRDNYGRRVGESGGGQFSSEAYSGGGGSFGGAGATGAWVNAVDSLAAGTGGGSSSDSSSSSSDSSGSSSSSGGGSVGGW